MKTSVFAMFFMLVFAGTSLAQSPYLRGANPKTGEHDKYLGNLNQNPYDPNSVNNPYGQYGSPYSSDSIRNPYSTWGSPYSTYSPNNPYTNQGPKIYGK